jgi:hypothetical protein
MRTEWASRHNGMLCYLMLWLVFSKEKLLFLSLYTVFSHISHPQCFICQPGMFPFSSSSSFYILFLLHFVIGIKEDRECGNINKFSSSRNWKFQNASASLLQQWNEKKTSNTIVQHFCYLLIAYRLPEWQINWLLTGSILKHTIKLFTELQKKTQASCFPLKHLKWTVASLV